MAKWSAKKIVKWLVALKKPKRLKKLTENN
jgi:hypothetical protein